MLILRFPLNYDQTWLNWINWVSNLWTDLLSIPLNEMLECAYIYRSQYFNNACIECVTLVLSHTAHVHRLMLDVNGACIKKCEFPSRKQIKIPRIFTQIVIRLYSWSYLILAFTVLTTWKITICNSYVSYRFISGISQG